MFNPIVYAVDDEANILSSLTRILRGLPINLRCFDSPAKALEALGGEKPAAVISDYRMPGMTGTELLERFRERSPGTTRMILSGFVDIEASIDAINRGSVYRLVRKPWENEALRNAIMAGVAESIASRAAGALRNLLGGLIGASTAEAALDALARFLGEESGLGLDAPELPDSGKAAGAACAEGELVLSATGRDGTTLSVRVPECEAAVFEAAGMSRLLADLVESALTGLSIALETINARSRLVELSEHDPLTGLLNRRAMMSRIETECSRVERFGHPFSVLLVDIDSFKLVNDRYGHAKGDAVIAGIGKIISSGCRTVDIPARTGGDEFLVGLPETDVDEASILAARLGKGSVALGKELGLEDDLTLSIGIAAARKGSSKIEAVLEAADASMYEIKRSGKAGVGVSQETPGAPPV
jgi:diguanylate cyclase (GGDEF)-like protein